MPVNFEDVPVKLFNKINTGIQLTFHKESDPRQLEDASERFEIRIEMSFGKDEFWPLTTLSCYDKASASPFLPGAFTIANHIPILTQANAL